MRFLTVVFFFLYLGLSAQNKTSYNQDNTFELVKNVVRVQNNSKLLTINHNYSYYEKTVVSAHPDSISSTIDTIYKNRKKNKFSIDSSSYKFKKLVTKQHLYQFEKVSDVFIKNSTKKEEILGIKMAGLKQPIYELIGQEFMPTDFTKENLKFLTFTIKNPVSLNGSKKYIFSIDTNYKTNNTNLVKLNFNSTTLFKKNKVNGYYIVNKNTFAIQKAVFIINGIVNIQAETNFEWSKKGKNWYPISQNLLATKGNHNHNIDILGETIRFDNLQSSTNKKFDYTKDLYLKITRKYLNYNFEVTSKKQLYQIQIDKNAISNKDLFLTFFEKDSLDARSDQTHKTLDSLVTAERIEKKIYFGKKLINGQIPLGFIDLAVRHIFKYNNPEGFRLGLGLSTNDRFSNWFKIFGYGAYGTKDGVFKSQIGTGFRLSKKSNTWLSGSFTDDITEFADVTLMADNKKYKLYDPRPFNISTFYNHQTYSINIESKFISQVETLFNLSKSRINPLFNYVYQPNNDNVDFYNLTLASLSFEWSPYSKFLQSPQNIFEVEKNYPKFLIQIIQSVPNVFENEFNFTKIDTRIQFEKKYLSGHKTTLLWQAGISIGQTPLSHLYSIAPNNLDKNSLLKRITFASKTSFETMFFNEFYSDKYTFLQFKHYFYKIVLSKSIKPIFVLGSKAAFGYLAHPEYHSGITFKTMEKGFFESGLEIQNIFKGFGISSYYRYGPYQLPRWEDNLAIKISFTLNLGL